MYVELLINGLRLLEIGVDTIDEITGPLSKKRNY